MATSETRGELRDGPGRTGPVSCPDPLAHPADLLEPAPGPVSMLIVANLTSERSRISRTSTIHEAHAWAIREWRRR
jgi:hypothetical protein